LAARLEVTGALTGGVGGSIRIGGVALLSLLRRLVELACAQQMIDQTYQLAGRQHTRPFVRMGLGLAVFGLVVGAILLVVHPQRVGRFHQVVTQIGVPRMHYWGVITSILTALVLFPAQGGEIGQGASTDKTIQVPT